MKLKERLDLDIGEVKNYLKLNNGYNEKDLEDRLIKDLIEVAKEQAGAFLNNDFTTEKDGELEFIEVPVSVKLACLKMIATWYEIRTTNVQAHTVAGFSVSVGDIPLDAEKLLHPHRRFVGL